MKELSIEEKAKAYDSNYKNYAELINRLEDVKEAIKKQNYGIAMDVLCKSYPEFQVTTHSELKEREGERIRKEIIQYIKTVKPNWQYFVDYSSWIAWLEKQGEQKPAWSEEDDYNLQCMIAKVTSDIQKGNICRNNELIDWLKFLKGRIQPQPKQEFDENGYNRIISFLKQYANSDNEVEKQNALSCINWLKSVIKHEEIIKYKIGDRVRFYLHSPVFTISGIDEANERYISQSGDHISFYEELILVKSSLNKDDIKCGDYLTTEDGTVIKVHDVDENECVHYFYYASEMTEDGGDISNNFMHYCAILSDCRKATQEEIDFLEKWVAHKKYVWVKNNVNPYDEEED